MYAIIVTINNRKLVTKHYASTRSINGLFKRLRKQHPNAEFTTVYVTEDGRYYDLYDNEIHADGNL